MRDFQRPGRSTVHALNGMVATSHPQAALAAVDMLRAGGTAADAVVAAAAVLCVVEPQSTGIGGDCFALYAPQGSDKVIAYNASGPAPKAASAAWYLERGIKAIPLTGPHSVSIPGAVDGWARLLADHGRKGIDAALQAAIRCAEDGYVVAPRIAFDWAASTDKLKAGTNTERFLLPGGRAPRVGDVIRQPELASTLKTIAKKGRDAFYSGAIAEDMVATLRSLGGLHTLEDFSSFASETLTPIKTSYRGHEIWECPPNGPGITALLMMNILGGFDLAKYDPLGVERLHLEAEATRLAFAARETYLGDPRHAKIDVEALLSPAYANEARARITLDRAADIDDARPPMHPSTIYISVVDRDRNTCSFIHSVAYKFGAAIVAPKTGIVLQNRGAGFRIQPGHPNCIAGGKRPLHTIIPGMATKGGRAVMPFGVMGGQYQPVGHTRLVTNVLDYGMDVQEAIDHPRGMHYEGIYQLETGVPDTVVRGLQALGHKTVSVEEPHGGGQAVWIDWERGTLTGGTDPRKDGCALGY
jgi:gamma-glutamyltranspeptidase / glutathione hydrolase